MHALPDVRPAAPVDDARAGDRAGPTTR